MRLQEPQTERPQEANGRPPWLGLNLPSSQPRNFLETLPLSLNFWNELLLMRVSNRITCQTFSRAVMDRAEPMMIQEDSFFRAICFAPSVLPFSHLPVRIAPTLFIGHIQLKLSGAISRVTCQSENEPSNGFQRS